MEAAITSIHFAMHQGFNHVTVHTHSEYLRDNMERLNGWIRNGWRKPDGKRVKNRDLWEELNFLRGQNDIHFEFNHGDPGSMFDEIAHRLARKGAANAKEYFH